MIHEKLLLEYDFFSFLFLLGETASSTLYYSYLALLVTSSSAALSTRHFAPMFVCIHSLHNIFLADIFIHGQLIAPFPEEPRLLLQYFLASVANSRDSNWPSSLCHIGMHACLVSPILCGSISPSIYMTFRSILTLNLN